MRKILFKRKSYANYYEGYFHEWVIRDVVKVIIETKEGEIEIIPYQWCKFVNDTKNEYGMPNYVLSDSLKTKGENIGVELINSIETYSKDNFWNKIQEKYPKSIKAFYEWIDEYKKNNQWNSFFPLVERKHHFMSIKVHHLPVAMQFGIFTEYISSLSNLNMKELGEESIEEFFKMQENL